MVDSIDNYLDEEASRLFKRYQDDCRNGASGFYDADEYASVVSTLMLYEDFPQAMQVLGQARERFPSSVELKLKQAELDLEAGFSRQALAIIEDLERVEPYLFEVHLVKGHVLKELSRIDQAREAFLAARANGAEDIDVEMGLAAVELKSGNSREAWEHMRKFIGFESDTVETGNRFIDMAVEGDLLPQAMEFVRKLLKENPYRVLYWKMLSELAEEAHCYEQALEAEDFVLAIIPEDKEAWLRKFRLLEFIDTDENQLEFYLELEKRTEDAGERVAVWLRIAQEYELAENFPNAWKYYQRLLSFPDTRQYALFRCGVLCHFFHDTAAALRYFRMALAEPEAPESDPGNTARIYRAMARSFYYRGEADLNWEYNKKACETSPDDRFHLYALVEDACDFGLQGQALAYVEGLQAASPSPFVDLCRAVLEYESGNREDAYAYFAKALSLDAESCRDADVRFSGYYQADPRIGELRDAVSPPFDEENIEDEEPYGFYGPDWDGQGDGAVQAPLS